MSARVLECASRIPKKSKAGSRDPIQMDYDKTFETRGQKFKYAVETYPHVFDAELQTAVAMCRLNPGETLLNIPAACVSLRPHIPASVRYEERESNEAFAALTEIPFAPLHDIGLPPATVDVVVSLASLHHATDEERRAFYIECRRILRHSGRLVIGDVIKGSPQDKWLNEFVDTHNSSGHKGLFWNTDPAGAEVQLLEACGFSVSVSVQSYFWTFSSVAGMCDFVRNLFGLDLLTDDSELLTAIQSYLGFESFEGGIRIPWKLAYFVANPRV